MQFTALSHHVTRALSFKGRCKPWCPKTLLVMKLTSFFLLAATLQVSAKVHSQTVSYSAREVPIEQVFQVIKAQTGYVVFCNASTLQGIKPVTITAKNLELEAFLKEFLKGLPLEYTIKKKTIIISPAVVGVNTNNEPPPPPGDIHGTVTDSLGNALAGASVTVKGSKRGTGTNEKGNFELKGISDNATLIISFTGFESKEYRLNGKNGVIITLSRSNSVLDNIQVIAYGQTTQRLNVGNVTTVNASDIEKQPVDNPLLALEGRVPGLFITQSSGLAGSGVTVQIQGQNSIQNGNNPFYVIDGVPYIPQLLTNLGGILGGSGNNVGGGGTPLSYINPADIETISVLKDADATAIYGSRAANGAILITTKKGKGGQTRVDFSLQQGIGQVTRRLDMMNTQQYLQMRHEGLNNDGITPSLANGDYDLLQWDTTRNTDWQKALIGGTAHYSNFNATASGGNSVTQYLIGGTYHRQTSVFPGNYADQKGSLHFNINTVSTNQKFRLQLSGNYLIDNNQLPGNDLTNAAITLAADAPPLYNADGSLNWAPSGSGTSTFAVNPLAFSINTYENKIYNLIGNSVISYQVLPCLEIKSSFGYTTMQQNEMATQPLTSTPPEYQPYTLRTAQYSNNNINSWIIEPQASYRHIFGKGKLDLLMGSTIEQNNSNGQILYGSGYNSDLSLANIASASTINAGSTAAMYKYNAVFGRASYNWSDKYLVNFSGRRDGSSRFGPANQFHDFAAAGIGWIFSKEEFVSDNLPFISFGKLRASYGSTGNDQIGDYQFLSQYSTVGAQVPYQGALGLIPTNLPNPYLQWELTRKAEAGLDIGFIKDRILLNATYFQNRSSNQLLGYSLPVITGFLSVAQNLPATVQNMGLELTLGSTNVKTKNFNWSTHVNLTIPRNKLVAFPGLTASSYANLLVVGQPLGILKVYHLIGVNDTTGTYEFSSSKGNPTYNPSYGTDNNVIVSLAPKFYGGVDNRVSYKGFEIDFLFQFVKQIGFNYAFGGIYPGTFGGGLSNQPTWVLDRWQKPGDVAHIQKYSSGYSLIGEFTDAAFESDGAYTDASYIRLKNLSLSWQLPEAWDKNAHLHNFRIFIQGQNLLTLTRYKGMDPENMSTTSLPPLKVVTFGLQIGL